MKTLLLLALLGLGGSVVAWSQDYSQYFKLTGRCAGEDGRFVRNGRDGIDIKPALAAISKAAHTKLQVYSCFRSQDRQNELLRSRGCAPFGNHNCSQSTARVSQHTKSVAADLKKFADYKTQCQAIAQGRRMANGRGGVGTYPAGDGHFDMGSTRSWNRCKGIVKSSGGPSTPALNRVLSRGSSGSGSRCYPQRGFPSCCGPIRAARGLCSM